MKHLADFLVGLFLILIYPALGFGLAGVKYATLHRWDWFMVGLGPLLCAFVIALLCFVCFGITQLGQVVRHKLRPVRY